MNFTKGELHDALRCAHMAQAAGIPWTQIIEWIFQFGVQYVMPFLSIVLPLIMAGKMTITQAEQYLAVYVDALIHNRPPPPPPVSNPMPSAP